MDGLLGQHDHVEGDAHPFVVCHRQEPDLVVLGQRQADMDRHEYGGDAAAHQVLHGRRRAAIGDVLEAVPVASLKSSMER